MKKKSLGFVVPVLAALATYSTQAEIILDHEPDPIPVLSMRVVLPVGVLDSKSSEVGAAHLLSDILDAGTLRLDKQAFQDTLASYGASVFFSPGKTLSTWSVTFPIIEGKDYTGLIEVLKENWRSPRLTSEVFLLARSKLESGLKGSLDNDGGLVSAVADRWTSMHEFGHRPLFMEDLQALTLAKVQALYNRDFLGAKDLWAGLVGPQNAHVLAEQILKGVFGAQASGVRKGKLNKALNSVVFAPQPGDRPNLAILVDKADRTQLVTRLQALSEGFPESLQSEIAYYFGNHILYDSGLGSYFGDEIRNKRGLAYSVGGVGHYYLRHPTLGLRSNPVRDRGDEALAVVAELFKEAYQTGAVFETLPKETWDRQWKSFRYAAILSRSSAGGRLGLRTKVVIGEVSPEFAQTLPKSWDVSREDLQTFFKKRGADSTKLLVLLGSADELKGLVKKHFPDFQVHVMPFRDSISSKGYQRTEASKAL